MENISRMVSASLARNGVEPSFDHLRLEWSRWFRCESSFSVLLAPSKPGIFALGEEVVSPGGDSKRMLALFHISETDDVGMALGRLFLPGNPLRERLDVVEGIGEQLHRIAADRPLDPDSDRVEVTLGAGTNRVLVKVDNGSQAWGFALRIYDDEGLEALVRLGKTDVPPLPEIDEQRRYRLRRRHDYREIRHRWQRRERAQHRPGFLIATDRNRAADGLTSEPTRPAAPTALAQRRKDVIIPRSA
jgi:hypothetical protein